jgi:transposase
MPKGKPIKPEEIINVIREVEVLMTKGISTEEACRKANISTKTFYKWRREFDGMDVSQAKKLKDLEKENARLKKIVADQALDISMLKEVSRGNF